MIKEHETTLDELIHETDKCIKHFHSMLMESRQNGILNVENESQAEFLMYSPDEWELICLALYHYKNSCDILDDSPEERWNEWFEQNALFVAFMHDVVCLLYSRMEKKRRNEA